MIVSCNQSNPKNILWQILLKNQDDNNNSNTKYKGHLKELSLHHSILF
jgi:hypothetical protein